MHPHPSTKGFVLLEAIIAIGILGAIFAGTMMLYQRSLAGLRTSSSQLTATYLAQDAAEWLTAKQQFNKSAGRGFMNNMECADTEPYCMLDTLRWGVAWGSLVACTEPVLFGGTDPAGDCNVAFNGNRMWHYITFLPLDAQYTDFKRQITEDYDAGDESATFVITVRWREGSQERSFVLEHTLYDYDNS